MISVEAVPGKTDVYCLTVPSAGCFCLAGGFVVSNCDAFSYPVEYLFPINREGLKTIKVAGF